VSKWYVVFIILLSGVIVCFNFFQKRRVSPIPSFLPLSTESATNPTMKENDEWTLIATGDVIPARSVNYETLQHKDFTWAWKNIAPILKSGDITLINLESPLIKNCPVTNEGFAFCGDIRHVEGLLYAGVDIVSFANNHMGNFGASGIEETKAVLAKNAIDVIGTDAPPPIKIIKGVRVGFLAYNDIGSKEAGIAWADEDTIKQDITELKTKSDVIIVSMSWGIEYTAHPSERQQEFAHLIVDSGADLIIGNHPHWIQSSEIYKEKFIMYAHGNTIFDQMWSEETKMGVIGKYTFSGKTLVHKEFIPTYIEDYGQPKILTGSKRETILKKLQ